MNRFERAIDNIQQKGWHQGDMYGLDGSPCLLAAMELPLKRQGVLQDCPESQKMATHLRDNCTKCMKAERINGRLPDIHMIWRHNDHHMSSQEDALLLLKEVLHD